MLGLARRVENRDLRSKLSLGNTWLDLLYNLCGTYVASAPGEPHISRCSSHFLALLRDFLLRKRPRMNPYPRSAPKLGGWATWSGPIAGRHNLRWSSTDQPATWKQFRRFSFLIKKKEEKRGKVWTITWAAGRLSPLGWCPRRGGWSRYSIGTMGTRKIRTISRHPYKIRSDHIGANRPIRKISHFGV